MKNSIDYIWFNGINSLVGRFKFLDIMAVFFASWLAPIMIVFLFAFSVIEKNAHVFIVPVLAGCFSRYAINGTIYFFYKRKRPPQVLNSKTLIACPNHPAFPSGHSSFFFAISVSLLIFNFIIAVLFIILTVFISFFRVFAGVHWPTDILAGMAAGTASGLLFLWISYNL